MKRLGIATTFAGLMVFGACGQLIGLDEYSVQKGSGSSGGTGGTGGTSSGGSGGSATTAATGGSGGVSSGGGSSGGSGGAPNTSTGGQSSTDSAGAAGAAGTPGCADDSECSVRNDCVVATCEAGACVERPVSLGEPCAGGVCDGANRCLVCVDDSSGSEPDSGCPTGAPDCDSSGETPECVGCNGDGDCDDGLECTSESCENARCVTSPRPSGSPCSLGVCNGQGLADSCVTCIDSSASDTDAGCSEAEPRCSVSAGATVCVECIDESDCDDTNDCTAEVCNAGTCESSTEPAGTLCLGGMCNGVSGMESCGPCIDDANGNSTDTGCTASAPVCDVGQSPAGCTGCVADDDCDDQIACTTDSCNGSQVCVHTPDSGACADSGDVCRPNRCVGSTGCQQVDISQNSQLLTDGSLDSVNGAWQEASSNNYPLVYNEADISSLLAHTPSRLAWLGGAANEFSELWQVVRVPAGTVSLQFNFQYQLVSRDAPDDHNQMGAQLRSANGQSVLVNVVQWANQDETDAWTLSANTIDATALANTDIQVYMWAQIGPDGMGMNSERHTNFFVDSLSVVATVCE